MKKLTLTLLLIVPIIALSQPKKNLYLLVEENLQVKMVKMGYEVTLSYESRDKRFSHDNYKFWIMNQGFDRIPLRDLAVPIALDTISYTTMTDFFESRSACEAHEFFSLHRVAFIREVPAKDPLVPKQYRVWGTGYLGTNKNFMFTAEYGK